LPLYFQRNVAGSLSRGDRAEYQSCRARVATIDEMLSSYSDSADMTGQRKSILIAAKDRHLAGMVYSARRCLSHLDAVMVAIRAVGQGRRKRTFLLELAKTLVFPLRGVRY
jgi:hypothetical protein